MALSSFTKDFTLKSRAATDSLGKILSKPMMGIKIDRNLVSPDSKLRAETKLKQMLLR